MEYTQITLNEWLEMKEKIKRELNNVKYSFVRIGYMLRKTDDRKLYENDGYKSIGEFAQATYGLQPSTTSRFIKINKEYSVDGYSEILRPEYEEFGRSQLEEMLKLPESDREMIEPNTPRDVIRDLKKFNKGNSDEGPTELVDTVIEFFKENDNIANKVRKALNPEVSSGVGKYIEKVKEILIPSGNRTYKKGIIFLMLYEDRVTFKKFGGKVENLTWEEFGDIIVEALEEIPEKVEEKTEIISFPETAAAVEANIEEKKMENEEAEQEKVVEKVQESPQILEEPIAPAQFEEPKKEKMEQAQEPATSKNEEKIPETEEVPTKDEKITEEAEEQTVEILEESVDQVIEIGNRKKYLDSLSEYDAAKYLQKQFQTNYLTEHTLASVTELIMWLKEPVDQHGNKTI